MSNSHVWQDKSIELITARDDENERKRDWSWFGIEKLSPHTISVPHNRSYLAPHGR